MKILILPSWSIPLCQEQALGLKETGAEVAILSNVELPWTKYGFKTLFFRWGFFASTEGGILYYKHYSRRVPRCEKLNFRRWVDSTLRQFDFYVRSYGRPDIIHAHSSIWAGYAAFLIKQKYNIPYVITEHRGRFSEKAESLQATIKDWYVTYLEKAFSQSGFNIPVSSLLVKKIDALSGNHGRIAPISNVVNTDFFYPVERRPKQEPFTFFTANSFDDAKGYDVLLKAFDAVCGKKDVRLIIAGDGFDIPLFQAYLSGCKNRKKVTFAGYLQKEAVRQNLWEADAFVLASRVEAQPVAVLEALSTGLPVVCTEVVPPEVIVPGTGYQVAVNRADLLAQAMVEMVENRDAFDEEFIAQHARSIADPKVVVQKLIAVYTSVLEGKI
jgi:L-malate glycosyltransferase